MGWGDVAKIGAALGTAVAAAFGAGNVGLNQGRAEVELERVPQHVVVYMGEVMHDQQVKIEELEQEIARLQGLIEFH